MTSLEAAKELQRQDDLVGAAVAYEEALNDNEENFSLSDYIDAAVLYFVCTDFGYVSSKNLPESFARSAFANAKLWLDRANKRFGTNPEVSFWRHYFDYVVLGAPDFIEECRSLVEKGETSVPYFYLFSSTRDHAYKEQAEELYKANKSGETAKQRYIGSVLAPLRRT